MNSLRSRWPPTLDRLQDNDPIPEAAISGPNRSAVRLFGLALCRSSRGGRHLLALRRSARPIRQSVITVFEPASEALEKNGSIQIAPADDQSTVVRSQKVFDAQVGFNLLPIWRRQRKETLVSVGSGSKTASVEAAGNPPCQCRTCMIRSARVPLLQHLGRLNLDPQRPPLSRWAWLRRRSGAAW